MMKYEALELEQFLSARDKNRVSLAREKMKKQVRETEIKMSLEPFPPGSFETLKNTQVWEKVMDYFTNPLDWSSLKLTCPTFHDILLDKEPLSEVLKIMKRKDYFQPFERPFSAQERAEFRRHLEQLRFGLEPPRENRSRGQGILLPQRRKHHWSWTPARLRLISKTWKLAIEEAFMNEFSGEWHFTLSRLLSNYNDIFANFHYQNLSSLRKVIPVLQNSSRISPLVGLLEINEFSAKNVDNISPQFYEFLDNYGRSVQGLIIHWSSATRCSPQKRYRRLQSLVIRMPNLKALIMQDDAYRNAPSAANENVDTMDLQSLIRGFPFPTLPFLEFFSLKEGYAEENLILKEIFSKSANLKSVLIPTLIKDADAESVIEALSRKRIVYFQQNDWVFPDDLLRNASWPLRELHAKNCCASSSDVQILNQFGSTLEYLELGNLKLESGDLGVTPLKLPRLKKLYLGGLLNEYLTGLDFLIPLESLEDLTFTCPNSFLGRSSCFKTYKINVYEYVCKMDHSNIWKYIPRLKKLRIEGSCLSRIRMETFVEYTKKDGIIKKKK